MQSHNFLEMKFSGKCYICNLKKNKKKIPMLFGKAACSKFASISQKN